jgi:L-amino acid N-acyltransferase YncA
MATARHSIEPNNHPQSAKHANGTCMRTQGDVTLRPMLPTDRARVWGVLEPTIRAGETYALPQQMSRSDALRYWTTGVRDVFVAEKLGRIEGTCYLRAIRPGGGDHVANCGFMVGPWAAGQGVGRAMCAHSITHARSRGFRAMQFNFVVSTNSSAIRLWTAFGFDLVGRLPAAFRHPRLGYVDALVMHRSL